MPPRKPPSPFCSEPVAWGWFSLALLLLPPPVRFLTKSIAGDVLRLSVVSRLYTWYCLTGNIRVWGQLLVVMKRRIVELSEGEEIRRRACQDQGKDRLVEGFS